MVNRLLISLFIWATISFSAFAQFESKDITAKFDNYQSQSGRHILHLSLNQPEYALNDTVFFKAYLAEENRELAQGSHVATAALYGQNGLIDQIKYQIRGGVGVNQLVLPKDLSQGIYKLISYTNWMMNFDSDFLFEKEIKVVDRQQVEFASSSILSFAISGNQLIEGIETAIVAKSNKANTEVELLENGMLIESLKTGSNGLGQFKITPKQGGNYGLRVKGSVDLINLPKVKSSGVFINVNNNTSGKINLSIISRGIDGDASLVAIGNGRILNAQDIKLQNESGHQIDLSDQVAGRIAIYLLSSSGDLLAFENTYHEPKAMAVPVTPLAASATRGMVKLSFEPFNRNEDYSMHAKVLNGSVFGELKTNHFQDELNYFADAPYDFVLDRSANNWQSELQQYLTLTAKPLNWSEILFRDTFTKVHVKDNMIRRIAIASDSLGKPLDRGSRIMMYFHKEYIRLEGLTGANGKIRLHFPGIEAQSEMFYSAMDRKGNPIQGVQLQWLPEIEPSVKNPGPSVETEDLNAYGSYAAKRSEIANSYDFFQKTTDTAALDLSRNFMDAFEQNVISSDDIFKTADYELFPTMKEYINEVIKPLQIYNSFGRTVARIKSLRGTNEIEDEPLFIIDGIGTKGLAYFLALDPKTIEEIRVIRQPDKLSLFSTMGKSGIMLIQSKEGSQRPPINPNNIIEGMNPILKRVNMTSDNSEVIPVFNANVYWEPEWLNRAKELRFTQTDDIGQMRILVEGYQNGRPASYIFKYEAKPKLESN